MFWRAWHLRNDVVHAQGKATVRGSVLFLTSYEESLDTVSSRAKAEINGKGKEKVPGFKALTRLTCSNGHLGDRDYHGDPPSSPIILPRISSLHPIHPPPHHLPSAHQPPNQSPAPRFESRSRFELHSALKSPDIQEVEAALEVPQKRVGAARQGA
jgi:hypothetical protein